MKNILLFSLMVALFSFKSVNGQQVFKLNIDQPPPFTYTISNAIFANEREVINLDTLFHVEGDISYFSEWSFYDGIQHHTIDNPLLTLTTNGVLHLTVIDENGCTTIDSVVFSVTTDIEDIPFEQDNAQNVKVYPNPNDGTFIIQIMECLPGYSIQLINSLGVQLLNKPLGCNNSEYVGTILIPNKASGLYFLLLKNENKTLFKQKVMVYK